MSSSGEEERGAGGTQAIGRAVLLLRLVAAKPHSGVSLSELVDESGLSKPTCRRILLALIEAGLVAQEEGSRRYFLGREAFVIGTMATERYGIHRLALDSASRLAQATGDAAFFQVRSAWSIVCLHREDGDYPIRSHVLAAGDRHPLGVGAGGLALLAALPDSEVEAALAANDRWLRSRYPVLTNDMLLALVRETRERGYSMNRGLLFPGAWGMGMAVRDRHGRPEACLSIAAIESRLQPDREAQLAGWLSAEVRKLEKHLRDLPTLDMQASASARAEPDTVRRKETLT